MDYSAINTGKARKAGTREGRVVITIDQERAEKVFEEMKAERDKNYPNLSGMARLLSDLKLREAVIKGARAYEQKRQV